MNIAASDLSEVDIKADIVVLPLFEAPQPEQYADVDDKIGGLISRVHTSKEFTGKENQLTLLHVQHTGAERILLVGMGKGPELTSERLRQAGGKAFSYIKKLGLRDIAVSSRSIARDLRNGYEARYENVMYFIEGGILATYRFEKYKKAENGGDIRRIAVLGNGISLPLKRLRIVASAVYLARDLVNTPSNDLTPGQMSESALNVAGRNVKVRVLNEKDIKREAMEAYLAVARGSGSLPRFIIMEYKGGRGAPVVLVGKSITFDSGGISIKAAEGMEKMKYDMAGGAAVLSVIKAISEMAVPLNVTGILPAAENMPGSVAFKPGDVVNSIGGKTIEIISTDAEGRLTLADAIGYAIKYYKPRAIVDIATLTGACSLALGNEAVAMMGTDIMLMELIKEASLETGERVWQMPLYDEYRDYLKSDIADIKNAGGRNGSLVTAASFLKEFAGETPWVHLDIAGTAWNEKEKPYITKGSTGVGVRLLIEFLDRLAGLRAPMDLRQKSDDFSAMACKGTAGQPRGK
ncbi:MAG: leucyl aminopeptidase [Nitrospirae bacterium]|nr:leucyl aminopeptidase [Nitrospirota bacterium]